MDLYAVYLGGHLTEGRMGEDHEVVFVAGDSPDDARRRAKRKWGGVGRPHIDAIERLDVIDGFQISLSEVGGDDKTSLDSTYVP
ncbi:MAG: hypothetical protein NVSMB12_15170 [Acidimicrobiales bacterium]